MMIFRYNAKIKDLMLNNVSHTFWRYNYGSQETIDLTIKTFFYILTTH